MTHRKTKTNSPAAPKRTVAIVGTHPNTREEAPFNNPSIDIWVFNNQAVQGWMPRVTASFDIHVNEDIYRRATEHPQYGEWLKVKKGVTVYTPYPMPEIPDNEVYPLEAICAKLLPNFRRGDNPVQYFTSGPCYALALAIYMGYERIEFYGIEMENNSEYIYQRDGIALWFGIALGRGVEVMIPKKSIMFTAPLYGYEMDGTKFDREAFETRASEIEQVMQTTLESLKAAEGRLNFCLAQIQQAKGQGISDQELINTLGKAYEDAQNAYNQAIANHAFVNGQYIVCREFQAKAEKALEYSGRAQEVVAMRDEKWGRLTDKQQFAGHVVPSDTKVGAP